MGEVNMKLKELRALNNQDSFRVYTNKNITYIDENTPYSHTSQLDPNKEVEQFFIYGEYCCSEVMDEWIAVILKE